MKKYLFKIGILSFAMLSLLISSYILKDLLGCEKEIFFKQKIALNKASLINRELEELKTILSKAETVAMPSEEERYFKLLAFFDLLSVFKKAKFTVNPDISFSNVKNVKDVYTLRVEFETDTWADVEKLFKFFDNVMYPIIHVKYVKIITEEDKAKFTVVTDLIINPSQIVRSKNE